MKKVIFTTILVLILVSACFSEVLETIQSRWNFICEESIADVAITTFDYSSWPTGTNTTLSLPERANGVIFMFYFSDDGTHAGNAPYTIYARKANGPILKVAAGTVTEGAVVLGYEPINGDAFAATTYYWATLITDTYAQWLTTAKISDIGTATSGTTMATLSVDTCGFKDWYVEIGTLSGVTNVSCIVTWY